MGARASIRDVGRALGMPYEEVDRVARLVPFKLHVTLDEALELSPEMAEIYHADESIRKLVDTARNLEGLARHSSTHAAGVVISKEPLDDVVPLQKSTRGDEAGVAMTQYAMEPVAALGLLKMDFLGLANLTILAKARDLIAENLGVNITLRDIPLNDAKTFELLSMGETVGVFQLEGAGMTRYIKDLKPSSLRDVAAMIALYRPGPMEHIGTFIQAKHGLSDPHYPHPGLEEILRETYGVIVYQDQVLHIFRTFAGYSLGEADIVRKAMGKKIPEIMAKEREKFIQGALRQSYTRELAEELFALIQPFRWLRLQQGSQRQLRSDFLLDCLPEGQLPCPVHGIFAEFLHRQHGENQCRSRGLSQVTDSRAPPKHQQGGRRFFNREGRGRKAGNTIWHGGGKERRRCRPSTCTGSKKSERPLHFHRAHVQRGRYGGREQEDSRKPYQGWRIRRLRQ